MPDQDKLSLLLLNHRWLQHQLQSLGHRVFTAGCSGAVPFDVQFSALSAIDQILERLPGRAIPDAIVYYDNSAPLMVRGLENCGIPSIFYSVDAHHHHWWHRGAAEIFDRVLVAQKDYIDRLSSFCASGRDDNVVWFPPWATFDIPPEQTRSIDLCFRGTLDSSLHPQRVKFFKDLGEILSVDAGQGSSLEAYPKAKIVVNQTVSGDLNFRVFEAMGAGALLLTPSSSNGLSDLFHSGTHLVLYENGNVQQVAELARYYLEHEDERRQIAQAGREAVRLAHCCRHRAIELEKHCFELKGRIRRDVRFGSALMYLWPVVDLLHNYGIENLSEADSDLCRALLTEAVSLLFKGSMGQHQIDVDGESMVLLCCTLLEKLGMRDELQRVVWDISQAYPNCTSMRLCAIEQLARSGCPDQAIELAQKISTKSDAAQAIVENAGKIINDAREYIFQEIMSGKRSAPRF